MRIRTWLLGAIVVGLSPGQVFAQDQPLSTIVADLLLKGVTMESTTQTVAGNPHEAHFIAALSQDLAPFAINKALVGQLGTFPIGSSSGGFVFNFDPASGLFRPASQSFGPGFAERALTNGQGRFGFGFNYQRLEFSSFEGADLEGTDPQKKVGFVLQHNDCCPVVGNPLPDPKDPFFEGDLVTMLLSLNVKTDMFAPFLSYGLNNNWDVGVVVPVVRVQLSPTVTSTIDRISTGTNSMIHSWDGLGQTEKKESLSGTATGLGDLVLRTKYRFVEAAQGGIAGGLDVRLPTGDKDNLLGTGAVQTKLSVIASGEFSRFGPHVNLGYTLSRGELSSSLSTLVVPPEPGNPATLDQINSVNNRPLSGVDLHLQDEVNYVAGLDFAAHSLVTISADVIGRTLLDSQRFGTVSQTYQYRVANSGPILNTNRSTFDTTGTSSLNLLLGVVGAKVNIPGTPLLFTTSVLFSITDAGLRPKVTPVVGLDYSFKR